MSLIFGYTPPSVGNDKPAEEMVKSVTITTTFAKYNNRRIVKTFDHGVVLLGVVPVSGRLDPPHSGLVFYDIYNTDGSNRISDIRTRSGNYFNILNKDSGDVALKLYSVYTIPGPCSITARLSTGSRAGSKPGEGEGNMRAKRASSPPGPVNINTTLHYIETPTLKY